MVTYAEYRQQPRATNPVGDIGGGLAAILAALASMQERREDAQDRSLERERLRQLIRSGELNAEQVRQQIDLARSEAEAREIDRQLTREQIQLAMESSALQQQATQQQMDITGAAEQRRVEDRPIQQATAAANLEATQVGTEATQQQIDLRNRELQREQGAGLEAMEDEAVAAASGQLKQALGELALLVNPTEEMRTNPVLSAAGRNVDRLSMLSEQGRQVADAVLDRQSDEILRERMKPIVNRIEAMAGSFRDAVAADLQSGMDAVMDQADLKGQVDQRVATLLRSAVALPDGSPVADAFKGLIAAKAKADGITEFAQMPTLAFLGDDVSSKEISKIALKAPGAAADGVMSNQDRAEAVGRVIALADEGRQRELAQGLMSLRVDDPERYRELADQIAGMEDDIDADLLETTGPVRDLAMEATYRAMRPEDQEALAEKPNRFNMGGLFSELLGEGFPREQSREAFDRQFTAEQFFQRGPAPEQADPQDEQAAIREMNYQGREGDRLQRQESIRQTFGQTIPNANLAASAGSPPPEPIYSPVERALMEFQPEVVPTAPRETQEDRNRRNLEVIRMMNPKPTEQELTQPRRFDDTRYGGMLRTEASQSRDGLMRLFERAREDFSVDQAPRRGPKPPPLPSIEDELRSFIDDEFNRKLRELFIQDIMRTGSAGSPPPPR